jgi:hypothetical protein
MEQEMYMRPYILIQRLLLYYREEAPLRIEAKPRYLEGSRRKDLIYTLD